MTVGSYSPVSKENVQLTGWFCLGGENVRAFGSLGGKVRVPKPPMTAKLFPWS